MRRLIAVAAALTTILLYITTLGALSADEDALTTTLHPGWNLVGWIHEETPTADLFEQLDSLESIHDGSGQSMRRPVADAPAAEDAALTLQPGRGYWLRIGSDQPLDWTRPAEPSTLRFQLEPGNQLVAWAGPSDRSIDDVLLGLRDQLSLAWRWIAAEQRYIPWSPNLDIPAIDAPPLNRGDAVRIDLLEPTEWLHPTGDLPRIQFAGGLHHQLPDNFREMVEADLRFVVERFAAKFQFEVPADRLILRIPTTPEADDRQRARALVSTTTWAWAATPAVVGGVSVIVMPWYIWPQDDAVTLDNLGTHTRSIIAHEYFHVLQYELAGPRNRQVPGWLVEGGALWSNYILFDWPIPDFDEIQGETVESNLSGRTDPHDFDHGLGHVATAFLVRRAGLDSVVDFWRNFKTNSDLGWRTIFTQTYGLTFTKFAAEFHEHRRSLFGPIGGQLRDPDGRSLSHLYLRAIGWWRPDPHQFDAVDYQVDVAPNGAFSLPVMRIGPGTFEPIRYTLILGRRDSSCRTQLMLDGTLLWRPAYHYDDDITLPPLRQPSIDLDIRLPTGFCRHPFTVRLFGNYGAGRYTSVRYCFVETSGCASLRRQPTGEFKAFVPFPEDYRIRVGDERVGCGAYVADGGFTDDPDVAARFTGGAREVTVRVRLDAAEDLCSPDSLEE